MKGRCEEVVCVKVWLEPGSENLVREWARYIVEHRAEALQTLQEEGVSIESVFFDASSDTPCLVYYMRSVSQQRAQAVANRSAHAIDAYHRAFKKATWSRVERLELLVDLAADQVGSLGPAG